VPLAPVSPVESRRISDVIAPTPDMLNNLTSPQRNELVHKENEIKDVDFKDEYSSCYNFEIDHSRFTENFFEYEQGQKDIIVRNRLKSHIQFWCDIGANPFILDTIKNGYKFLSFLCRQKVFLVITDLQ
jgi:hypothetical protein